MSLFKKDSEEMIDGYRIPQFDMEVDARLCGFCALVNGRCDEDEIACDECLFNTINGISTKRRRAYGKFERRLIKKVKES